MLLWSLVLFGAILVSSALEPVKGVEKPLVRCKRPLVLCETKCPDKGYQLDLHGCPTCKCMQSDCWAMDCVSGYDCVDAKCTSFPCTSLPGQCVPMKVPEPMPCAIPMCSHPCPYGYKNNARGCMTCDCADAAKPHKECPLMKCKVCEHGYEHDENGCNTCKCSHDPCQRQKCAEGQKCISRIVFDCGNPPCSNKPICVHDTMCQQERARHAIMMQQHNHITPMAQMMPHMIPPPECDDMGKFRPKQCHGLKQQCWCVDDRGEEVKDSRHNMAENKFCKHLETHHLIVSFTMIHQFEDITIHLTDLKMTVREHISRWLMIEQEHVQDLTLKPHEEKTNILIVEFVVMSDGKSDLPTTAFQLRKQMHHNKCNIPFKGKLLTADPDHLNIHHNYGKHHHETEPHQPRLPNPRGWRKEPSLLAFCKQHRAAVIAGGVGMIIFFSVILFIVITAMRKKRMGSADFSHRRLENYENNLAFSNEVYGKGDLLSEKKIPITGFVNQEEEKAEPTQVEPPKQESVVEC